LAPSIDEGLPPEEPSEEPEWLQGLEEEAPWKPEEVLEGVEGEPEWLRELGAPADEVRVAAEEEVPAEEETAPWLEALEGLVEEVPLEPREKEGLLAGIRGALRVEPIFAPVAAEERARVQMTHVLSWLFYLILAAAVVGGILLRGGSINLPLTQATADFYKAIESLEEGSVALLSRGRGPLYSGGPRTSPLSLYPRRRVWGLRGCGSDRSIGRKSGTPSPLGGAGTGSL